MTEHLMMKLERLGMDTSLREQVHQSILANREFSPELQRKVDAFILDVKDRYAQWQAIKGKASLYEAKPKYERALTSAKREVKEKKD